MNTENVCIFILLSPFMFVIVMLIIKFVRKMCEVFDMVESFKHARKKTVTINGNTFYVWLEEFVSKDGKVLKRPHIENYEGKDITNKFETSSDLHRVIMGVEDENVKNFCIKFKQ